MLHQAAVFSFITADTLFLLFSFDHSRSVLYCTVSFTSSSLHLSVLSPRSSFTLFLSSLSLLRSLFSPLSLVLSMSTEAPPPCPSSCFKLYYPPGFLGRAEPIRLLFTEAGQAWEEPWAAAGLSHEQALEECERMRGALQQPVFGLPWLEHYRAPHTVEQKEERKAADTTFLSQSPVSTRHITHTTQPSQSSLFKPYVSQRR